MKPSGSACQARSGRLSTSWRNCSSLSSARRRASTWSVTSIVKLVIPSTAPPASRVGVYTALTKRVVRPLVLRKVTGSCVPTNGVPVRYASARMAGNDWSLSSGSTSASGRPSASSAERPHSSRAPGLATSTMWSGPRRREMAAGAVVKSDAKSLRCASFSRIAFSRSAESSVRRRSASRKVTDRSVTTKQMSGRVSPSGLGELAVRSSAFADADTWTGTMRSALRRRVACSAFRSGPARERNQPVERGQRLWGNVPAELRADHPVERCADEAGKGGVGIKDQSRRVDDRCALGHPLDDTAVAVVGPLEGEDALAFGAADDERVDAPRADCLERLFCFLEPCAQLFVLLGERRRRPRSLGLRISARGHGRQGGRDRREARRDPTGRR